MDYSDYVLPELLVLIPVLYILGEIIKSTENIDDGFIPLILGIVGVILSAIYVSTTQGLDGMAVFTAIVQGVLVAGCAVYANQIYKQTARRGRSSRKEDSWRRRSWLRP